ncbi:MAG: DNA/pantothenate metabolism flavoprotein domain protein [Verrucomicrobia bacterium]|nr:DNA/pantothenate metabolism flavoprotein domain protein [Verrucomicrobiota bacterium]
MKCLVTAGPTWEPLDEVRRLTNFSTGRLGSELANYLADRGHEVMLLLGAGATYGGPWRALRSEQFTTTADLRERLERLASHAIQAVLHTAAVSDFRFGRIWREAPDGTRTEWRAAKLASSGGAVLAELVPAPKLIAELRDWFPRARLVGWKYELDGNRALAVERASQQIAENHTDGCVVNGRAYGPGFGLVTAADQCRHLAGAAELYAALADWLTV